MKINPLTKKIANVIFVICMSLILLFIAFSTSFAWLSNNKKTNGSMIISVNSDKSMGVDAYQIFRYSTAEGKANLIYGSGMATEDTSIDMMEYDTVFEERNAHTPLVIRAEVNAIPLECPKITMSATCIDGHKEDNKGRLDSYMSNVIAIKMGVSPSLSDIEPTQENANTIYEQAISDLSGVQSKSFATSFKSGDNFINNKINNIELEVEDGSYTLQGNGKLVLFIILSYSKEQVDSYVEQRGGVVFDDISNSLSEYIYFDYDILPLEFNHE